MKVLFIVLCLALCSSTAMAQRNRGPTIDVQMTREGDAAPARSGFCDPLKLLPGCKQPTARDISVQDLITKILNLTGPDLDYAIGLATSANTNSANVRLQCLNAIKAFNQQVTGRNVTNASGIVPEPAEPHIFTTLEQVAEGIDNLSPTSPLFTGCAGTAALMQMEVVQTINAIVSGTAAAAVLVPK